MSAPSPDQVRLGRVRQRDWARLSRGVHVPSDADLRQRLEGWRRVLPEGALFTGLTAAELHGLWLPHPLLRWPVFAVTTQGDRRVRRPGLVLHRMHRPPSATTVDGLPVTDLPETILACARELGVLDLAVLVGSALRLGATRADLLGSAGRGRPGSRRVREAISLTDPALESAGEALLLAFHRMIDVDVVVQYEIVVNGVFIARGDQWLRGTRAVHEYDGADHRDREQHRDDLRRERRLSSVGVLRRGFTLDDLVSRAVTVLRDVDSSLGRPHDPSRVRPWLRLVADSSYSPAGRAALHARWRV